MAQFQIECVESNTQENRSQYSKFVLEPLDRGQGTTVGNALRRVLLSNLEGTAVTAVRIAGVSHEFATIPGVREDVLEILMRMKEVVLKKLFLSTADWSITCHRTNNSYCRSL